MIVSIIAILIGSAALGVSGAMADQPEGNVCSALDSGKIDVSGSHTTLVINAPAGQLISQYCVKAGSVQQGEGPEYVDVTPPVAQVTISHTSGKDISHYSVAYVTDESPTYAASLGYCKVAESGWTSDTASVPKTYATQDAANAALVTALQGIATAQPGAIIPSFSTFAGLNWDTSGQATLRNGCVAPPVTFEASQSYCAVSGAGYAVDTATVPKTYATQDAANAALVTALEGIAAAQSGAIIPTFSTFAGNNWTTAGQAIFNAGCVTTPPTSPPPTTPPAGTLYAASQGYCAVSDTGYTAQTASVEKVYGSQSSADAALVGVLQGIAFSQNANIIPPFSTYVGNNWTTTGQTIYGAGCATTPVTTPPVTPTIAPSAATVEEPAVVTAPPAAGTVEQPMKVSAAPLPASVPAGGGGSSDDSHGSAPWAIALITVGAIGLLYSATRAVAKR